MKQSIFLLLLCLLAGSAQAQSNENGDKYRRSSLYSVLVKHPEKEFCNDIIEVFGSIPIPEKFDNHDLKNKVINAATDRKDRPKELMQLDNINKFMATNAIGRRLVAKWFNRDVQTGAFNMNLVAQRGYYDASIFDIALANQLFRKHAVLADAGQELIGNTFVIVNDIRYVDKEEAAAVATLAFTMVAVVASGANTDVGVAVSSTANLAKNISEQIAGFTVNVTSYLYRLDWTEDIADTFYEQYWMDSKSATSAKKSAFDAEKKLFTMTYVGAQTVSSGKTTLRGVSTREDMIKKVCTRAIDEAIVQLQRNHDEFKVKTPLLNTAPLTASIGKKEGVAEGAKYEVLELVQDENGRTQYKRMGVIAPVKGKIWDNRYLSVAELSEGSELVFTEFKKVSGGDFEAGMLIREIK
jgi:hypothetical protein